MANDGYYDIETIGEIDTQFTDLSYRIGNGNINIVSIIDYISDDDGEGRNAKYGNVFLEENKTYILTLEGWSTSTAGNTAIKISGSSPNTLKVNSCIRTSSYTITDDGRFSNNYDTINFYTLFGQNITNLKQLGYTKISMSIEFYAHEQNDGYQYFWIYDGTSSNSTILYDKQFEHSTDSNSSTPQKYIFSNIEIELDDILSNSVYIRYGASGNNEDTWFNYGVAVNINIY